MRRVKILGLILALAVCATAVGVALAASGRAPAKPHGMKAAKAATASVAKAKHHSKVKARSHARTPAQFSTPAPGDADNVQEGDQTTPDTGAEAAETETTSESESTPGNSVTDGVEQPPGADHQCPPDCSTNEAP